MTSSDEAFASIWFVRTTKEGYIEWLFFYTSKICLISCVFNFLNDWNHFKCISTKTTCWLFIHVIDTGHYWSLHVLNIIVSIINLLGHGHWRAVVSVNHCENGSLWSKVVFEKGSFSLKCLNWIWDISRGLEWHLKAHLCDKGVFVFYGSLATSTTNWVLILT